MKPVGVALKRQPASRDQHDIGDADDRQRPHHARGDAAVAIATAIEAAVEAVARFARGKPEHARAARFVRLRRLQDQRRQRRRQRQRDEGRDQRSRAEMVSANCW